MIEFQLNDSECKSGIIIDRPVDNRIKSDTKRTHIDCDRIRPMEIV